MHCHARSAMCQYPAVRASRARAEDAEVVWADAVVVAARAALAALRAAWAAPMRTGTCVSTSRGPWCSKWCRKLLQTDVHG